MCIKLLGDILHIKENSILKACWPDIYVPCTYNINVMYMYTILTLILIFILLAASSIKFCTFLIWVTVTGYNRTLIFKVHYKCTL